MVYTVGLILFALGIVVSLALHEAGHALVARALRMKVTRFFIGFGPTLFSFRRRGCEFGVKAIPAGAFVMIPALDRYKPWKRTLVRLAGPATHFGLGAFILWGLFAFVPLDDAARLRSEPVRLDRIAAGSAAERMGLRPGDVITAVDGAPVVGWDAFVAKVRASKDRPIEVAYSREGRAMSGSVTVQDKLGVTPVVPKSTAGPAGAVPRAADQAGLMFTNTLHSLQRLPEKIPALIAAIFGAERDPESPVSVVGASHLGGVLFERGELVSFLLLLAALNFFIGVFNLLPILPADGGHIAIAWYEKLRGRRLDPERLLPVTYAAIGIFAVFTLLTVVADLINPVSIPA